VASAFPHGDGARALPRAADLSATGRTVVRVTSVPLSQPAFDDLGEPLIDVCFVVVDLETTGSGPDATITEFGAVKVRGGELLGEFQSLVNPGFHIPGAITVLTGITDTMVADAPPLDAVLPAFLAFAEGCVLVAHNAPFDIGFLKRACRELGYDWPGFPVVDTVALARQALLRDEVPNVKLGTLAAHFHTAVAPDHRALDDARATVDVLHGLLERVGCLGVYTLQDLREFTHHVSPGRRAKRGMAEPLPAKPGVYCFVADLPGRDGAIHRQILYVGKSRNIKQRVRTYFTASETRRRMDEMIRIATGVEATVCRTPLEADVLELRLIGMHEPRYNRRSKFPERHVWLKLTDEAFPRLSVVRRTGADQATYFGPFRRTGTAEEIATLLQDAFGLRSCTTRLSARTPSPACALADIGRCPAPCRSQPDHQGYAQIVERVRAALSGDVREVIAWATPRIQRLADDQRYEDAGVLLSRVQAYLDASRLHHRLASLAACPELVAACHTNAGWEIHVIKFGRLAGAALARRGEDPMVAAQAVAASADTVAAPSHPATAGLVEEAERVADWLESPGVRLIETDGEWNWPLHACVGGPCVRMVPPGSTSELEPVSSRQSSPIP